MNASDASGVVVRVDASDCLTSKRDPNERDNALSGTLWTSRAEETRSPNSWSEKGGSRGGGLCGLLLDMVRGRVGGMFELVGIRMGWHYLNLLAILAWCCASTDASSCWMQILSGTSLSRQPSFSGRNFRHRNGPPTAAQSAASILLCAMSSPSNSLSKLR